MERSEIDKFKQGYLLGYLKGMEQPELLCLPIPFLLRKLAGEIEHFDKRTSESEIWGWVIGVLAGLKSGWVEEHHRRS